MGQEAGSEPEEERYRGILVWVHPAVLDEEKEEAHRGTIVKSIAVVDWRAAYPGLPRLTEGFLSV
jgi:hypothetical protein